MERRRLLLHNSSIRFGLWNSLLELGNGAQAGLKTNTSVCRLQSNILKFEMLGWNFT